MTIIAFRKPDNSLSLCTPTGEVSLQHVFENDVPPNSGARILDPNEISDAQYKLFNALEMHDVQITLNMEKAVEITKIRLRFEREPLLAALDVQFQRAIEAGADTTAIVQEKQRLRDITNLPSTSMTPEELVNITC